MGEKCKVCKLLMCNQCNHNGACEHCHQIEMTIKEEIKRKDEIYAACEINEHCALDGSGGHHYRLKNVKKSRWRMNNKLTPKSYAKRQRDKQGNAKYYRRSNRRRMFSMM